MRYIYLGRCELPATPEDDGDMGFLNVIYVYFVRLPLRPKRTDAPYIFFFNSPCMGGIFSNISRRW